MEFDMKVMKFNKKKKTESNVPLDNEQQKK